MIQHCVFINFKPETASAERASIFADIAALRERIPGFLRVTAGKNVSPEGLDKGFSEGFIIDFADGKARDQYLADSEHVKVATRLVAAAQGGSEGVLVFDLDDSSG